MHDGPGDLFLFFFFQHNSQKIRLGSRITVAEVCSTLSKAAAEIPARTSDMRPKFLLYNPREHTSPFLPRRHIACIHQRVHRTAQTAAYFVALARCASDLN